MDHLKGSEYQRTNKVQGNESAKLPAWRHLESQHQGETDFGSGGGNSPPKD